LAIKFENQETHVLGRVMGKGEAGELSTAGTDRKKEN